MEEYRLYAEPVGIALIVFSAVAVALVVERAIAWVRLNVAMRQAAVEFDNVAADGDRAQIQTAAEKSNAPLGRVLDYVLRHAITDSPETTQLLLEDALDQSVSAMKRNQVFLVCLAGTAPFLGLLGTVRGIMSTFSKIRAEGMVGGPAVISGGISEALQTTAWGLMIAIPTLIAYNIFNNMANEAGRKLRMQSNRILVALGDL